MEMKAATRKFVYKIHSTRLRKARWDLTLPIDEAMKNNEIIPIADSTMLRWIDELSGISRASGQAEVLRKKIVNLQHMDLPSKRKQLRSLYLELNKLQFCPGYLCLIIDKLSDYDRAVQKSGFRVNGIRYRRLLATNGGVKNRVIIFTSEQLLSPLKERLNNGRNMSLPHVPAKFGSYEALACSSTVPVSSPDIIIVPDCKVSFKEDIIRLDDSGPGEPSMTYEKDYPISKNASDGFGLILPSRAVKWGLELGLDYIPSGFCTRPYAWGKGMVVTFDFHEFASSVAHEDTVVDIWGDRRSIFDADVILTASMLKLWDSYNSLDDYLYHCRKNHYEFGITKVCPPVLEEERNLNYQFIQSYHLSDSDIEELVKPTADEFQEVLGENSMKAVLFLRGTSITEETAAHCDFNYIKALQIDERMAQDPHVRTSIYRTLKKRIDEAKTGVLKVHGNYQIACGDPYALCQSIFGLPVTGLLKKGEFYSKYWTDRNVQTVTAFRAPMTCHNNIRLLNFSACEDQTYWYRYLKTILVFNCWDTTAEAMNGEDFDGDMNFTTDNAVLMRNHRILPAILCIQRRAEKKVITEDLLIKANKDSFGDDIGIYTNGITSQFEVQSCFPEDSPQYKELEYRIICGQLFQQNAIDKTKGILAKSRPKYWFDNYENRPGPDDSPDVLKQKEFRLQTAAVKKPYFLQYVYPQVQKDYKKYICDTEKKCRIEFGLSLEELMGKSLKSEEENLFLEYYEKRMPVGTGPSVMNRICRIIEGAFDQYLTKSTFGSEFDWSILKSGCEYKDLEQYRKSLLKITLLYKQYQTCTTHFMQQAAKEGMKPEDIREQRIVLLKRFRQECLIQCPNPQMMSDIILDITYSSGSSRQFAWDICGDIFVENLLQKNNNIIRYPEKDPEGSLTYLGETFTIRRKQLNKTL